MDHPAPPGLRERKRLHTWQSLRAAALDLVAARGFEAVSVDEIAAAAGVSRRTFFNYFASKEAALFDPDPGEPAQWHALLAARPPGEPVWTSLREVLLAYTGSHPARLVAHKRIAAASPALARSSRDSTDAFWTDVEHWVRDRSGDTPADHFHCALLIACAQSTLRTATARWQVAEGPARLHAMISTGFDRLGAGLLGEP